MFKNKVYLGLLCLLLLGFWLRVHGLEASSLWIDEGLTPLRSSYGPAEIFSNRVVIQEGVTYDTHPAFYYLLVHFSRQLWGESDFGYRYLSLVFGVLLIPVVYQLGRRLESRPVGLVAAMLLAVSPSQIWYSQEARMYTLLAWLAALGSYGLWRAVSGREHLLRWFTLYLLSMGLAFYTHYTAIFLIAGQGIAWLWLLWRAGYRRLIGLGLGTGLLLLIPIIPFTVPRLFTGAETNYFYVPIWIMLQDVVHGFGLGLTADFSQWYVRAIDVGLAIVLLTGCFYPKRQQATPFLLLYLLATVGGLALGSLIKPMYMGIRHIFIGGPAFFLLAAMGIVGLWRGSRPGRWAAIVASAIFLTGSLLSLHGLYRDPLYAKDDVRGLIAYVQQRAGEQDLILFHDAISLPLFWHYNQRPDLDGTALPIYPYLADEQTIGQLATLAGRYQRIWFVWGRPADKRDEAELVAHWLAENLQPVDDHSFHGRFGIVRVTAFAPPAGAIPPALPLLNLTSQQLPTLQQITPQFKSPAGLPTLWFQFLWQAATSPDPNLQLRLTLRDPAGQDWLSSDQPLWAGAAWPAAGLATAHYALNVPAGTPAGTYRLMLQLWHKSNGATQLDWQEVGQVTLADSSQWPIAAHWPFAGQCALQFDNGVSLQGVVSVGTVRPGHPLPLDLYWQGGPNLKDVTYQLEVVDSNGKVLRSDEGQPAPPWWQPAGTTTIVQHTGLYIRPESLPGRYTLRWSLSAGDTPIPGRACWPPWPQQQPTHNQIIVEPWPLVTQLPPLPEPTQAQFGSDIELYGYELAQQPTQLNLTLYWRALNVPAVNYKVFVHVLDPAGNTVAQADQIPVNWLRPTTGWRVGELLTDSYQLPLPAGLPNGPYQLFVGLYNEEDGVRPEVLLNATPQPNNQLLLRQLTLDN